MIELGCLFGNTPMQLPDYRILHQSSEEILARWPDFSPVLACVLGSGWGALGDLFRSVESIPYADIPALGAAGVVGHAGKLTRACFNDRHILLFEGRRHWYESASITPIMFPMFLAARLQVPSVLLTNAAGGIHPKLQPGALMLVQDHINLMGFNPLMGARNPIWGDGFPDMSLVYDPQLRSLFRSSARARDIELHSGVYCAFSGPSYETPAEIRMAQTIGADAVGMSTVPSAILARAAGMSVLAISCISNRAAGLSDGPLHHEEVLEIGREAIKRARSVFHEFVTRYLASLD